MASHLDPVRATLVAPILPLADVFAAKDADEQVSERNRAEQIGSDRDDEHAVIQSISATKMTTTSN